MSDEDKDIVIAFAETREEREAIYRQRYEVYAEEMHLYKSTADHERKMFTDPFDEGSRLLYARAGDQVVGSLRAHPGFDRPIPEPYQGVYDLQRFASFVPADQMSVINRLMISKSYRQTRVSFRLVEAIYEFGLQHGTQLAFIACGPHLLNLYLTLGFRTYTRNFSDPEVGFVIPLVLVPRDGHHLASIRSPFLKMYAKYADPAKAPAWLESTLPLDSSVRSERADGPDYWSQVHGLLVAENQGSYSIFDGLSAERIEALSRKGHVIRCRQGELIIRKNTVSHGMYVVLSGVVEVRETDRILAVMGRGEVLGELGFLLNSPRTADVYAVSDDVQLLSLDEKVLRDLIASDAADAAQLLLNVSRVLCLRLVELRSRFGIAEA